MSARTRLVVAFISTGLVVYVATGALLGRVLGDSTYAQLALFNEVLHLVRNSYVEPVNMKRAMNGATLGLVEALDGDTAYLDPEALRAYKSPDRDTGADVGVVLAKRYGFLVVVSPRAGSPAAKAGLRTGDVLKTIGGRHTRSMSVLEGERLLRGAPGSVLELQVLRQRNDPQPFKLVREIWTPIVASSKMLPDNVGYLQIHEFGPKCAETVRTLMEGLREQGASDLVLDLRGSAFGEPQDAVKVAELFLAGGTVARLKGRSAPEQTLAAEPSRSQWALPLVVLVSAGTSGPGEILAGALLDRKRASLVGAHTLGRAAEQKLVPLYEGALLLTVAKYVTPGGSEIHGKGLEPTVAVRSEPEDDSAESAAAPPDPALEKAIELLRQPVQKAA
jgi:carboxyl-terminal processing protease